MRTAVALLTLLSLGSGVPLVLGGQAQHSIRETVRKHHALGREGGRSAASVSELRQAVDALRKGHLKRLAGHGGPNDREVLFLFYFPEVCDDMGIEEELEGSPDLLTTMTTWTFTGMEPPDVLGDPAVKITRTYDDNGHLARQERALTSLREVANCRHDRDNNLTEKSIASNGVTGAFYRATYNGPGIRDEETWSYDGNQDGIVGYVVKARYTYDGRGRYVRQMREVDDLADGTIESQETERISYDGSGFRSRVELEIDEAADDAVDGRLTLYAERNPRGRLDGYGEEFDFDNDGSLDMWVRRTNTYDWRGSWTHERIDTDLEGRPDGGADGMPDSRTDSQQTEDARGNLIRSSSSHYEGAPFETPSTYDEYFWDYDRRHQVTNLRINLDFGADGEFDLIEHWVYTYDRQGRLVDSLGEDRSAGSMPSYTHYRFAFSKRGNLSEATATTYRADGAHADGSYSRFQYQQRPSRSSY